MLLKVVIWTNAKAKNKLTKTYLDVFKELFENKDLRPCLKDFQLSMQELDLGQLLCLCLGNRFKKAIKRFNFDVSSYLLLFLNG